MASVEDRLQRLQTSIGDFMDRKPDLCQTDLFLQAEDFIGVPKEWIFAGLLAQFGILFLIFGGASLILALLGFAYPAYRTLRTVDQPGPNDDKQWLTYWMIFGALNFLEGYLIGPLLRQIPFWTIIKFLGLAWLYHGQTRGAETVYELVRPHVQALMNQEVAYVPPAEVRDEAMSGQMLVAKVLQGRNIPTANPETGASSPYCLIKLVPKAGRPAGGLESTAAYKTSTCYRTSDPAWTAAQFVIPLESDDVMLDVVVMDKNNIGNDHFIGSIQVDLEGMDEFLEWVPLEDPNNKATWRSTDGGDLQDPAGEIQLDLSRRIF